MFHRHTVRMASTLWRRTVNNSCQAKTHAGAVLNIARYTYILITRRSCNELIFIPFSVRAHSERSGKNKHHFRLLPAETTIGLEKPRRCWSAGESMAWALFHVPLCCYCGRQLRTEPMSCLLSTPCDIISLRLVGKTNFVEYFSWRRASRRSASRGRMSVGNCTKSYFQSAPHPKAITIYCRRYFDLFSSVSRSHKCATLSFSSYPATPYTFLSIDLQHTLADAG